MPEVLAIIETKHRAEHTELTELSAWRGKNEDRQTDSFSALYSRLAKVPALSCR